MSKRRGIRVASVTICIAALFVFAVGPAVEQARGDGGDDHSDQKPGAPASTTGSIPVRTVERNIETPAGKFYAKLRQTPSDPRTGEEVQFTLELYERVEGGFSGSGPVPLEGPKVTLRITTASGQIAANNIPMQSDRDRSLGAHYAFAKSGDFKVNFSAATTDNRRFDVDFPVGVVTAPTSWIYWLLIGAAAVLATILVGLFYGTRAEETVSGRSRVRRTIPVVVAALLLLVVGGFALTYVVAPTERRSAADIAKSSRSAPAEATKAPSGDPALAGSGGKITISKESQLLFSIRTVQVAEKQITGGLKLTGTVRARPEGRAVIVPPVSGRLILKPNISVGTAVSRGQQVGTIEQILGAPEQASLEGQRVSLRTAALEQQARQSAQLALARQARSRLSQAQRELTRARNLVEVGAAPKRRVEEAEIAVRIAEEEVASADEQARVAADQVKVTKESVERVNPVRTFPLLAPVAGVVGEIKVSAGQQVEAGTELMTLLNLTTVFLEAQVFEKDLEAVRLSQRATFTAAGTPGEVFSIGGAGQGRLVTIGQSVNPETRTVPVIFSVPNPQNRLRDGMFAEITIDTTGGESVVTAPRKAVVTEQGRTFVYVFDGGEVFEKRIVVLGSEGQDDVEIKSGLRAGDRVVVEGIYQLRSSQPGG